MHELYYNARIYHLVLLQPLRWRCAECAIHHERIVREEQHHIQYMWREQAIKE